MEKENLIPIMTSDTTPSGECKASSIDGSYYKAYQAFDGQLNTTWTGRYNSGVEAWVSYTFDTPTVANEISLIYKNLKIYWDTLKLYGDDNLLLQISESEGEAINDGTHKRINAIFDNSEPFKEYKLVFNTESWTYISIVELYCNKNIKFLLKQNNQYYSIKSEYYSNGQFQPLTLEGGEQPNENDYENFGFDNVNDLLTPQNTKTIQGIDKGEMGEGKYFEIGLDNEIKRIINIE